MECVKFYYTPSVDIGEETLTEHSDLCVTKFSDKRDIIVNSITFDNEQIIAGQSVPLNINITNNGTYTETGFIVKVRDKSQQIVNTLTAETTLTAGQTGNITVNLPLPSVITGKTEYSVEVISDTNREDNTENNNATFVFGYTDLSLKSTTVTADNHELPYIVNEISNLSTVASKATLLVKAGSTDGEVLAEYDLGTISANDTLTHTISEEDTYRLTAQSEVLHFEVVAEAEEKALSDNDDALYIKLECPVESIAFDKEKLFLEIGEQTSLSPVITPVYLIPKFSWLSSDTDVVTVDENGTVTAVGEGTATIWAISDNGKDTQIEISVIDYENTFLGDVNDDGNISLADAVIMQRMILEIVLPNDKQLLVADINGDGNITLADVTILMHYILGKSTEYAIGNTLPRI